MPTEFKLPELGENIESGDVVSVLVKEGDVIQPNQNVIEIETDKAVIEVPSAQGGRVTKIHVKRGDTVPVGGTVLTLEAAEGKPAAATQKKAQPAKAAPAKAAEKKPEPAKPQPSKAPAKKPVEEAAKNLHEADPDAESDEELDRATATVGGKKQESDWAGGRGADDSNGSHRTADPAGPAVRRLARELGVDLSRVAGSGPGGRITREDVIAAVRQANVTGTTAGRPAPRGTGDSDNYGPVRREKMSKIRKTIAVNMQRSASTIPHVTNFDDADITELERIRKGSMSDYVGTNVKLTMMPFLMKAVALSLKAHPALNASVDVEEGEIIYKEYVNLGVAVDTPRGLMVPVIRDVDRLSIPNVAQSLTTIGEKARATQITIEEMRGGTFTISNLGAIGGTYSTPIINPPEVAILLVGRSRKMPVVIDDKIESRLMMPLSLSYDHRLVDGATAARFLNEVIDYLETPGRLLLAP